MDRITYLEQEIADLKNTLLTKENELHELKRKWVPAQPDNTQTYNLPFDLNLNATTKIGERLPKWAIERYSRQILLPDIGVTGQERICAGSVLVVGAGGLGCPAAAYLVGAGVGEIGIVDYDTVSITNIHRQILHGESDQYTSKVQSAAASLKKINSHVKVTPYNIQLTSTNALDIVSKYQIVLDCSDNVPTRYLLGDVCAKAKVPLISGSALKLEGQLTIYGYRASRNKNEKDPNLVGPCYRCVFPQPPPPEAVGSCSAQGVAGPVPGVIGCLQALEAIKILVGLTHEKLLVGRMLVFDGEDMTFRVVKLRPRNPECTSCSETSSGPLVDYEAFCKTQAKEEKRQDAILKSQRRREEKIKRMTGQSYFGFRSSLSEESKKKWIQDVPKSERTMGPTCTSEFCAKGSRFCSEITEEMRREIFLFFWNDLDWREKKNYVRKLVDAVPPKRRRVSHKGEVSRKGDSKIYHLYIKEERLPVCRVMFLNTLGIKEAMVRCWLTTENRPKTAKKPLKSINVNSYIDNLPKLPPKCDICRTTDKIEYINIDNIKNLFQLYNKYVKDMKLSNISPASRKTFSKVVSAKNIRIFKPKNDSDVCDVVMQHNSEVQFQDLDKNFSDFNVDYYNNQW